MKIEINAANLSWGALMDLEDATRTSDIARWLVANAGCDMQELRKLPASEIASIAQQVGDALKGTLSIPKVSA